MPKLPPCSVRFVQVDAIKAQLDMGNIVLLTNLAYSASGEVLSCNIYDVATHAAIELDADKLICMTLKVGLPLSRETHPRGWKGGMGGNSSTCVSLAAGSPSASLRGGQCRCVMVEENCLGASGLKHLQSRGKG